MNIECFSYLDKKDVENKILSCEFIEEGAAKIYFPYKSSVFYNPIQEFNRDISICVIKSYIKYRDDKKNIDKSSIKYQKNNIIDDYVVNDNEFSRKLCVDEKNNKIIILEALAASGIRSIRYSLEIENVYKIISNDIQSQSVETIMINSVMNNVSDKILITKMEASTLLTILRFPITCRPDVIDIDPYGSPSIFLDSAVQCISDGGILCITATDMAVLCGNYPETTFSKYGSISIKSPFCHEMAIRILLNFIDNTANRYKRFIVPLLSFSVDYYIRVFVQVFTSPSQVKKCLFKKSYVNVCTICFTHSLYTLADTSNNNKFHAARAPIGEDKCSNCSGTCRIIGPVWSEPIQKNDFINLCKEEIQNNSKLYNTSRRIEGILQVISEEIIDIPFYYSIDDMFSLVKSCVPPSIQLRSAFIQLGYNISLTHFKKSSFKTNAPIKVIWDIVRAWVIKSNKVNNNTQNSYSQNILSISITNQIDFTPIKSINPLSITNNLLRYQINPLPNWGPKKRSKPSNDYDNN